MSAAAALRSPRTTSRRGLESPDAALISASRAGDSRAFEELYRRYRPGVRDLCQRMLGDTAKAEDLTQETFIRAYLRMERFQEGKSLWPWLSTIAHHLCIDEIRGRRRAPIASEETEAETETDLAGDLTSDEAIARHERAQLRARLSSALATLQPSDRRVVFLRSVEEWTYEDIARADGRTVDAIRNAAWRARTTLRTLLDTERERTGTSTLGFAPTALISIRYLVAKIWLRIARVNNAGLTNGQNILGEHTAIAWLSMASVAFALIAGIWAATPIQRSEAPPRATVMISSEGPQRAIFRKVKRKIEKRRQIRIKGGNELVSYQARTSKPRDGAILPNKYHINITVDNSTDIGVEEVAFTQDGDCNDVGHQIPDTAYTTGC